MAPSDGDQTRAPILEAIRAFHDTKRLGMTVPSHKQGLGAADDVLDVLGLDTFHNDIALEGGIDDRKSSGSVEDQALELAAQAWGADEAFFSTNGTSLSVQTALMAVARPGEKVLLARNVHKSAIAGLILGGIDPVFLMPPYDDDLEVTHVVEAAEVERGFRDEPEAVAVLVVSPSYYGAAGDLEAIARVCHDRNVPLVVDEAWGSHLPFHPDLPTSAMHAGADLAVMSFHKSIGGLLEGSMIVRKGDRVDAERLSLVYDLLESTSTSSLILAALDGGRRQMVREGRDRLQRTIDLVDRARRRLAEHEGLRPVGPELVGRPGVHAFDGVKLVVNVAALDVTGFAAADWLWSERNVSVELCDYGNLVAIVSIGDDQARVDRLVDAILAMADWAGSPSAPRPPASRPRLGEIATRSVMPPREAFFADTHHVPLAKAAGEIAAEMLSAYPPGIPCILPGERYTDAIVEYLRVGMEAGIVIPDASDPSLKTVRVVTDPPKRRTRSREGRARRTR